VVLLSWRNVPMYVTSETQTRVLERFAFALHEHGLLLLGKAEMLLTQAR
jgi:two-component system, chemotaxis family, CheB/CheR fusion protein